MMKKKQAKRTQKNINKHSSLKSLACFGHVLVPSFAADLTTLQNNKHHVSQSASCLI